MSVGRQLGAALRSLGQHKLRSLLSAGGIVFGVMALVAMLAVAEGAKREILAQIESLGTGNLIVTAAEGTDEGRPTPGSAARGLSLEDVELLRGALPGARWIAPLVAVAAGVADLDRDRAPGVVATTTDYFPAKGLRAAHGRVLCDPDVSARSRVCVLGGGVAAALGPRGRVGARVRVEDAVFEVVGVLEARGVESSRPAVVAARDVDRSIFVPLGTQVAFADGEGLSEISVSFGDPSAASAGAAVLRRRLDLAHGGVEDYRVLVPHELIAQAFRTQRVFNLVLGAAALISLLVGGTGILNIMLAGVSERTREIGIRRAVGASRGHIVLFFLGEASALTGLGGALGIAAGLVAARGVSELAGWSTVVTPWAVGLSLVMALGTGLAAGVVPAFRAARLDPIAALRHP